jgi:DNA helicase-2/ATP-dependent DNA helicase PcrA
VAITRAKERVTISYAQTRYRWGSLMNCLPSRFIREIDQTYVDGFEKDREITIHPSFETTFNRSFSARRKIPAPTTKDSSGKSFPGQSFPGRKLIKLDNRTSSNQEMAGFESDDPKSIQTGMVVEHQRFGKGKVIHLEGDFPNVKATVFFHKHGQKQLLLKFAKLKIIQ